jgi:hypothetical protein
MSRECNYKECVAVKMKNKADAQETIICTLRRLVVGYYKDHEYKREKKCNCDLCKEWRKVAG